ncbi:MAG TPA: ParB/RepB/Spo0J family partition protein [Campylobacterales bacterium]|nr:ParB/RepB/Spo0J family partition protein [Campylobacterales bacterium]
MAKRKIDVTKLLAAGEDANLQTTESRFSHAKIENETFLAIDVDKIVNNPLQPRLEIKTEELKDLMTSIKLHGLIQPITLIKSKDNTFILKAGQRRWLAHKKLGLKKIKAIVEDECDTNSLEGKRKLFDIAVLENTQRENLNPLELSLALQQALDLELYKSKQDLALALSKSNSYISKVLKVITLDKQIIEDLKLNRSTSDIETLYELQKIEDKSKQVKLYFDFINKKITRNDIREINSKKKLNSFKVPYKIYKKAKQIKLEIDIKKLSLEEKNNLEQDLKEIAEKYI